MDSKISRIIDCGFACSNVGIRLVSSTFGSFQTMSPSSSRTEIIRDLANTELMPLFSTVLKEGISYLTAIISKSVLAIVASNQASLKLLIRTETESLSAISTLEVVLLTAFRLKAT